MNQRFSAVHFIKDSSGFFIYMSEELVVTTDIEEYHRDMKWERHPIIENDNPSVMKKITAVEHAVMKKKVGITSHALFNISSISDTQWAKFDMYYSPDKNGGVKMEGRLSMLNNTYSGWPSRLCRVTEKLNINPSTTLSRKDMIVLHCYLNGWPRKSIANYTDVSVKAVEKRLRKVREKLTPIGIHHHNLHEVLRALQLVPFLLSHLDWFNLEPEFTSLDPEISIATI